MTVKRRHLLKIVTVMNGVKLVRKIKEFIREIVYCSMIKANELRIGNLVQFESETGFTEQVKVVCIRENDFDAEGDEVFHNEKYDGDYEPIPLTPEILEAAGFDKVSGLTYDHKDGNTIRESSGQYWYYVKIHGNLRSIQYLHQLQNLYFSLTGKELEIKFPAPVTT